MFKIFNSPDSSHDEIQKAGETFLLKLYGARNHWTSLYAYRYIAYKKGISLTSLASSLQLAAFPPTSAAAKQHSYRTYLAVQEWTGNYLQPTELGWKLENNIFLPVETEHTIAPDTLLNMISCSCKANGCGATCICRKMRVHCSTLCTKCSGKTCHNAAPANQCWM